MNDSTKLVLFILGILLMIVFLGLGPILTLLAMNALFGLNLGLTFMNWLSVVWLSVGLGSIMRGNTLFTFTTSK